MRNKKAHTAQCASLIDALQEITVYAICALREHLPKLCGLRLLSVDKLALYAVFAGVWTFPKTR